MEQNFILDGPKGQKIPLEEYPSRKYITTPNDSRNSLALATKVRKNNSETFFWIKEYEV